MAAACCPLAFLSLWLTGFVNDDLGFFQLVKTGFDLGLTLEVKATQ